MGALIFAMGKNIFSAYLSKDKHSINIENRKISLFSVAAEIGLLMFNLATF